jgi:hypothetical protein
VRVVSSCIQARRMWSWNRTRADAQTHPAGAHGGVEVQGARTEEECKAIELIPILSAHAALHVAQRNHAKVSRPICPDVCMRRTLTRRPYSAADQSDVFAMRRQCTGPIEYWVRLERTGEDCRRCQCCGKSSSSSVTSITTDSAERLPRHMRAHAHTHARTHTHTPHARTVRHRVGGRRTLQQTSSAPHSSANAIAAVHVQVLLRCRCRISASTAADMRGARAVPCRSHRAAAIATACDVHVHRCGDGCERVAAADGKGVREAAQGFRDQTRRHTGLWSPRHTHTRARPSHTHTRARAHKARARISRTAAHRPARPRPRAFGCRRKWHLWAEASVRAAMADSYEKERTVNGSSFAKSEIERMAALLQKAQSPPSPPPFCS